jgi:BirA family transcriptional regulator, biotin operon repressor / biotin---[acetyl-CoA-carboxylase] ligase
VTESPFEDLQRPPLNERSLVRALVRTGGLWREIQVVPETGSTNADLAAAARDGAPEGTVLVAELQTAGKGRLGRGWQAPPRSGLTFSLLLRPRVAATRLTWVPLLTGVAVAIAVERMTSRADAGDFGAATGPRVVRTALKWPNDVLAGDRKLCGILLERADTPTGPAAVLGIGLNVSTRPDELPSPAGTSLAIEGAAALDRGALLVAIVESLQRLYNAWRAEAGEPSALREVYRSYCVTLGRHVRVQLGPATSVEGRAADVDEAGRLVVETAEGVRAFGAGDVVHVR